MNVTISLARNINLICYLFDRNLSEIEGGTIRQDLSQ